jgi:hypothetical protein
MLEYLLGTVSEPWLASAAMRSCDPLCRTVCSGAGTKAVAEASSAMLQAALMLPPMIVAAPAMNLVCGCELGRWDLERCDPVP